MNVLSKYNLQFGVKNFFNTIYKFFENQDSSTSDFELPTLDFKEIVEAWLDYLQQ